MLSSFSDLLNKLIKLFNVHNSKISQFNVDPKIVAHLTFSQRPQLQSVVVRVIVGCNMYSRLYLSSETLHFDSG